ncbi:pectinesterase family protein [Alkaliflexus imshenetskii]|uniref:pectinesterase family protein n=1 Tax=Alkaliflexus imshenetskii TaxID=286730 RepID=UPI00138B139C|nr:pectinesterase family protein [Alkaliflexus imshenetskii]
MRKFTSFLFLALLVTLLNAQDRETIVSWTFSGALTPEQMLPNTSGTGSGNFYFTSTHATPATSFNNTFGRPAVRFNNHLAHPDDLIWHVAFDATGYKNIALSSYLCGNGTGNRGEVNLDYRIGNGDWTTIKTFPADMVLRDNLSNEYAVSAEEFNGVLDDQVYITLRYRETGTPQLFRSAIADIVITGEKMTDAAVHTLEVTSNNTALGTIDIRPIVSLYRNNQAVGLKANPVLEARFTGWFDADDNLLSEDELFVFRIHSAISIVARFESQIVYEFIAEVDQIKGTLIQSPRTDNNQYAEGTEITLQVERKFGYTFNRWSDGNTDNPRTIVLDSNKAISAIFDAVTTHQFNLNIEGSQWGKVQVSPQPVNGKYETGQIVNLKVVPNAVTSFSYWEDLTTNTERIIQINEDITLTATFDEIPFIVGWDFVTQEPRTGRSGDYYAQTDNVGSISLYRPDGTTVNWLANTGSFSPSLACIRYWTAEASFATEKRYLQASLSTVGYKNIEVKSLAGGNYQLHSVQILSWSTDGENFHELNRVDLTDVYNSGWKPLNATLPQEAEGLNRIYLRWHADANSPVLGTGNDGTAFTQIFIFADSNVTDDTVAPILISTVPANGFEGASASGSIVLTFNERVKAGQGDATLDNEVLTPLFGSKTATYQYAGLDYNTEYTFFVPDGAITDMAGNTFEGVAITFRTMERPEPIKKLFDFVVAKDGSGDGITIQSAFNAVPANNNSPFLIFVKDGVYNERPSLPQGKNKVSLIGQSRDGVVITSNYYSGLTVDGVTYTTSTCQTLEIMANDFYGENFTVQNTAGINAGQAVAMKVYGDRCAFKNIKLTGYQDTHLTGNGRQYYESAHIHGTVDFIFGGGDVFFNECLLYLEARTTGNVIVAPSTQAANQWGYVFYNCTIDGDAATQNNNYHLGRPWQNAARAIYINTRMNLVPVAEGWRNMSAFPALFAEYNSMTANGNPIDLNNRRDNYTVNSETRTGYQTVITDTEAAQYTIGNVLSGNDQWTPLPLTENNAKPENVKFANGTITWDAVPYSICYIIIKDGEVTGFTTSTSFEDETLKATSVSHDYQIVSVSASGSLSPVSEKASAATSIKPQKINLTSCYLQNGEIVVESSMPSAAVTITSTSGVVVVRESKVTFPARFKVPAGIYIVTIQFANKTESHKMIVR